MTELFTPGPWKWDGNSRVDAVALREPTTYTDENGVQVTFMQGMVAIPYSCGTGSRDANARLIAAAPDLLAALQRVMSYPAVRNALECEDNDAARAAIAAASPVSPT